MACTPAQLEKAARYRAKVKDSRHYREAAVARMTAWRASNPERARALGRASAKRQYVRKAAVRERAARYAKKWHAANPERTRESKRLAQATRRARQRGGYVERVEPRVVFERDEGICGVCGCAVDPADWHLDHVVALAVGGEHSYANVQIAHPACNIRKGVT